MHNALFPTVFNSFRQSVANLDKESGWGVGLQERDTGQACPSPPGSPWPTPRGGSGAAPGRPHHLAQAAEGPGGHKSQLLQLSPPQCCNAKKALFYFMEV